MHAVDRHRVIIIVVSQVQFPSSFFLDCRRRPNDVKTGSTDTKDTFHSLLHCWTTHELLENLRLSRDIIWQIGRVASHSTRFYTLADNCKKHARNFGVRRRGFYVPIGTCPAAALVVLQNQPSTNAELATNKRRTISSKDSLTQRWTCRQVNLRRKITSPFAIKQTEDNWGGSKHIIILYHWFISHEQRRRQ